MRHNRPARPARSALISLIVLIALSPALLRAAEELGIFEAQADVGTVSPPGTASYDSAAKRYRITSAGQNVWGTHDDFHFVYRKLSGDVTLAADIAFEGAGKNGHRKAGWMIRQGLGPDDPYVDVMVHGDGLISLQYRTTRGGTTDGQKATTKSPATVRLERRGDTFTLFVAPQPDPGSPKPPVFERVGQIKLDLKDPVYVGLAVSAHDPTTTETALFSNVSLTQPAKVPATP